MKFQFRSEDPIYRIKNIDVQKVKRHKNYKHTFRNGRLKHGFLYVSKGEIVILLSKIDGENITAKAGDLLFIPKSTVYSCIYLCDNTEIKIVQFDTYGGELSSTLSNPTKIEVLGVLEIIDSFFSPMENSLLKHPFYYLSALYNLLYKIEESSLVTKNKYKKLEPAITEITERYFENEKISYYANLCGMSEVNFRRVFREYTGLSPVDYRNDIRLKNALLMIESGEYNVSETAEKCGFSNLSFFIRLFKKKYGNTPKKI